jgi:hypothetical protein
MPEHAIVDIDWEPSPRTLRNFGCVACLVFAAVSFSTWRHGTHMAFSIASAALACSAALFALIKPQWNRALYVGLTLLSYPIAWAVAWLLLIALFFLVITPSACLYRAFGPRRSQLRASGSAWKPARVARDKASYFRQF